MVKTILKWILRFAFGMTHQEVHEQWLIDRLPEMMGFSDPKLFDKTTYQKEALLVLIASASRVQRAFELYSKELDRKELKSEYELQRNIYTHDVQTLQRVHKVFESLDIHWSKLPEFIREWQARSHTTWAGSTEAQIIAIEAVPVQM